jgi:hypothetical protein
VHRCEPSTLDGVPNTQQVRKGGELNPAVDGMGVSASIGDLHKEKETPHQSIWVFTAQSRPSVPAAGTGAMNDTLVLDWGARCENDRVSFAGRALYAATVLDCGEGDLILNTMLTARRSQYTPQLPDLPHAIKKSEPSSIVITMTTGRSANDLETHGDEAETWANKKNQKAVPKGSIES